MEAEADQFVFSQLYFDAMPRPSYNEEHGLNLNLIEKGQFEPIKVNIKMVILDGYTRWQLLGDRGIKIKYEFRYFKTLEEEINYVVECNVMRRNINTYQRVEAMLKLFGGNRYRKENADTFKRNYIGILQAVELGNVTSKNIAVYIEQELSNTRKTLKKLVAQWCLRRNIIDFPNGGNEFQYELLPKGIELLQKRPMIKTTKEIGKDIGVDRNTVGKALYLIENAGEDIKLRLINNTLTIGQAHATVMGKKSVKYKRVNPETKLKCPYCNHTSMKKDYTIV